MKPENELAMIVAFYLSKYGEIGLSRLGFQSYRQAFNDIAGLLGVKPNSIKNWRDEFDPYYDNNRKGWYQRQLRPSRRQVMLAFDELSESALYAIIKDIIEPANRLKVEKELRFILAGIKDSQREREREEKSDYVPRGPTGRLAEEFFMARQRDGLTPFDGKLQDRRDDGVGYDFDVLGSKNHFRIEIKGVSGPSGAITFTDKEWKTANAIRDYYYLGFVTHVRESPKIGFVRNPAQVFSPHYTAYTTVIVNWTVNSGQFVGLEFS